MQNSCSFKSVTLLELKSMISPLYQVFTGFLSYNCKGEGPQPGWCHTCHRYFSMLLPQKPQLNHLWLDSTWENTLLWELITMINHSLGSKCATSFSSAAFFLPASGSCHTNLYIYICQEDLEYSVLGFLVSCLGFWGFFCHVLIFTNLLNKADKILLGHLWASH